MYYKSIFKKTLFIVSFIGLSQFSFSQNKSSIAVANPNVVGLNAGPTITAKILRLELIKLDKYVVYDEFDMEDLYAKDSNYRYDCLSRTCLIEMGQELSVDYVLTGSFDYLKNKIVISLKLIDVNAGTIHKAVVREFDDQEDELQRMTEIVLNDMHDLESDKVLQDRLAFNNELITSNNVGKVKNNGPRVGVGVLMGDFQEFASRPTDQGGLGIVPVVSMIGFQLEGQYVGTENFSALIEGIVNIAGLEQGQFLPAITLMNGFRFGKGNWEIAFGPGIGITSVSQGFFDTEGLFGESGRYYSESDWSNYSTSILNDQSTYPELFPEGYFIAPSPTDFNSNYRFSEQMDKRGKVKVTSSFVFAFGKTFKAGAMNIPVNLFYSSKKGGGMLGASVGFNVMKRKKNINKERGRRTRI